MISLLQRRTKSGKSLKPGRPRKTRDPTFLRKRAHVLVGEREKVRADKKLNWATFTMGLWLIVAPFVLLYQGIFAAAWGDVIVGILIAIVALWHALRTESERTTVVSGIVGLLGGWTLISPFVLRYSETTLAMWNNVVVGILLAIFAMYRASYKSGMLPFHQQQRGAN
jgi:hypothetical protein